MEAVVKLREKLGMTQVEFAAFIHVSPSTVHRYETKDAPPGTMRKLLSRIAEEAGESSLALAFSPPLGHPSETCSLAVRAENRELHEKLEAILNSGDQGIIGAVVPNIEIFHDRMRPAQRKQRGA